MLLLESNMLEEIEKFKALLSDVSSTGEVCDLKSNRNIYKVI